MTKYSKMFRMNILFLMGIILSLFSVSAAEALDYQLTQLTYGDNIIHRAVMNNNGHIAWTGYTDNTDGSRTLLRTLIDGDTEINLQSDDFRTGNLNINENGDTVWQGADRWDHAPFLYNGTEIVQLDSPSYFSGVPEINNSGQIAWNSYSRRYQEGSIRLYDGVNTTEIFSSGNYGIPFPPHINDNGQIVISTNMFNCLGCEPEIILYDGTNLINFGKGRHPQINNKGQVVWVTSKIINSRQSSVISFYDGTDVINLGVGYSPKINDKGQVLWPGPALDSSGYYRGGYFHLYDHGDTILIESSNNIGSWIHPDAFSLNNQGHVAWESNHHGSYPTYQNSFNIYLYDGTETSIIINKDNSLRLKDMNDLGEILFTEAPWYHILFLAKPITNTAPVFDPVAAQEVFEGEILDFTVNAIDAEGDNLVYSMDSTPTLPASDSFDPVSRTFTWMTDNSDAGTYTLTFYATDDGNPAKIGKLQVDITVVDVPTPDEAIHNIITGLADLNLPQQDMNTYSANLKKVAGLILEGKTGVAINQLNAFITKVGQDITHNDAIAPVGQTYIDLANDLILLLENQ